MGMENRSLGERVAQARREVRARSHDGIERRTLGALVELRDGENGVEVHGHAAAFNDLSEDLGFFDSWFERIDPGAFASVLRKGPDVRALFNHDPNLPLARSTVAEGAGALSLSEDDTGLAYRFTPTPTSYAADLIENVRAGVVSQSSFAFRVARKGDTWEEDEEGRLIRTINQFSELYDVSPVTYPAYPTTDVGMSSKTFGEPDGGADEDPAPFVERVDDEPARQRVLDGDDTERHAEETSSGDDGLTAVERAKRRMRLRSRVA